MNELAKFDNINVDLAKFKPLHIWTPKLSDFLIYHGLIFSKWYGIINGINGGKITIIYSGLPILLFTMDQDEMSKKTLSIFSDKVKKSAPGKYSVLQDGIWYI